MDKNQLNGCIASDVQAVVTSYNQGDMILEAVQSLCSQTTIPTRIIIVDDGSFDEHSLYVLNHIADSSAYPVPVSIERGKNNGVSAARNTGIRLTDAPFIVVLDGDDRLAPTFIEKVSEMLRLDQSMAAASSWLQTFGVMQSVVCPSGGSLVSFLSHNCCPATHILRKKAFDLCRGYDETMRSGFEDWDYFLTLLETHERTSIGIVREPLIQYRTNPASTNIKSMEHRQELMRYMIEKHHASYSRYMSETILGIEAVADDRLNAWEEEIIHEKKTGCILSSCAEKFLESPSYGDGGMASAVRICSADNCHSGKLPL